MGWLRYAIVLLVRNQDYIVAAVAAAGGGEAVVMLLYFGRSAPTFNLQDKVYSKDGGHHRFL
jgi:hypothetical protein